MKRISLHRQGSTLIYTAAMLTVMATLAGTVLMPVSNEYNNTFRTASWQEALLAAESGVDLATIQLRQNLTVANSAPETVPWPSPWTTAADGTTAQTASFTHSGEGGTQMKIDVQVDAPSFLKDPATGWQYFRIRSRGTEYLSGSRRSSEEKRDQQLRRYILWTDRFNSGAKATQPMASRTLEVIARPASAFPVALLSKSSTTMSDQNVVVDSYDSSDPKKSTNGQWDVKKRQLHGDVATDGTLISAGNAHIYGNVSTNGGTVTGISNIDGVIRDDFYQDLPSIQAPNWLVYVPVVSAANATLVASTTKGGARYKSTSSISLSGNSTLTIAAPPGAGSATSYVEIWIDGDLSIKGNAQINVDKNVVASFYISGNAAIGGNGVQNGNGDATDRPANVLIYGLQPPNGQTQSFSLNGNANVEASIYAPAADVTIVGGGSNGSFSGSIVGNTIFMNGVTQMHYDEALKHQGVIVGYTIASWVEDSRR